MPKIAEFADCVLGLVAEDLEVPRGLILSKSRKAEAVDGRHLAIRLLHGGDVYPSRIASIFGLSTRSIHYIITGFEARLQANKSLRNNYAKIAKQLGNNSEISVK